MFFNQKYPFEKIGPTYQSHYKLFFELLNLIMASFCFEKLVKMPKNAWTLQSFLVITKIKKDNMLLQYPNETGWYLAFLCYLSFLPTV